MKMGKLRQSRLRWCFTFVWLLSLLMMGTVFAVNASVKSPVYLIHIKGGIGPATEEYVSNAIEKANEKPASAIILQMDTPGGLGSSMRKIIQSILDSSVPVIGYVAPPGAHAASAGTYLLYACSIAAMAPGTNLGAATPVAIGGGSAKKDPQSKDKSKQNAKPVASAGEKKALNDAKAFIRSLAQMHGRNVAWAEKAVEEAKSLSSTEALKANVINLIAQNRQDLLKQLQGLVVKVKNQSVTLDTQGKKIVSIQPSWRQQFLMTITNPSVAYILLMVGIYGLFFELYSPGLILPGVIGALSLVFALYAFQLLPVNYSGMLLILLGCGLLIAELVTTAMGVLGLGGVASIAIGSILLFDRAVPGFSIPILLIISVVMTFVVLFLAVFYLLIRSRQRPLVSGVEAMIGMTGKVVVNEQGIWLQCQGELWKIITDETLRPGQLCRVCKVDGLTISVEPILKD